MIYQFLSDFFNYHLFDALDNKTIDEIKSAFDKDLNQLISDLRQEKRDERTIRHGRKPIHTMFKRMFRSNKSLDRQVMRDGRKEIGLENEEEGVRKSLKQLLIVLTKERSKLPKEQVKDLKNKARELLLRFAKIVLQEFEAIHEAEVDVETQEADLIAEIKKVMKKAKGNQKVHDQLLAIISKIESHLKTDFYVARRMLNRAKALKQNIDESFEKKIHKVSNEIRTYTDNYLPLFKIPINSEKDLDNLFCRVAYAFGIENDVKIYIVGGYVRDKITGFESKDLDCNVSKNNDEFAKLFCQIAQGLFGFQFSTNQQSSTGNWKINCGDVKKDGYDVNKYDGDIKTALSTPDFTMNGIAIDITPRISQSEFAQYSQSLIYESKLASRNYRFLVYPDEAFLKDAVNKIFRIPESTKKGKDPKLGPRLLKFYERFFPAFEAKGFTVDKDTFNFLVINSGYLRIAKSGYLFRLQRKKELKKILDDPDSVNILNAVEQFRKEKNNRTNQEFLRFCQETLQEFNQKKCIEIFDFSFFPIREAIEEFIFSENQNKSYKSFLKVLQSKGIDVNYFGEKEIIRLWEHKQEDPSLSYISMVSRDYGQSLGFVIKTLKGTAKWLKNFSGDEDLRIYNCFKSMQDEGKVINSLIEEFNLENLRALKVQNVSNEYVRTDIRIAALLADLRFNINPNKIGDEKIDIPDSINKVFSKMSQSSTFTKQNQFFISVLLNIKELLLALRFFVDSEKHIIINSVKIKNMLKYMSKKNLMFMSEDKLINILLSQGLNIIKACLSLKGTKYFNPKFDVNLQEIQTNVSKLESMLSDESLMNFYSKPIIQNGKKLMAIGFKGPQIRVAMEKQIEAQIDGKIKTEEEAEQFLRDLLAA